MGDDKESRFVAMLGMLPVKLRVFVVTLFCGASLAAGGGVKSNDLLLLLGGALALGSFVMICLGSRGNSSVD